MSNITLRLGKGSPLTNAEVDANFTNLNTDKVESITSDDGSVIVSGSGTTRDLSVGTAASTGTLISQIRNETGATLTKGTVVYISGASGNKALVSKALASGDTTSAQTYGMVQADIPHNQNGSVVVIGAVRGLDTSAFPDGTQLYLSGVTAGTYTSTKPYAPLHLVYVGIVTYSHANQGAIEVKIQNGYEMDELHDVSAQSPTDGQMLVYNSTTGLWTKSNAPTITGGTINNTTIGATTPNTGVFTTLTANSTATFGGDATNPSLVASAVSAPTRWLQVAGSAAGNVTLSVQGTGTPNLVIQNRSTGSINFATNNSASNVQAVVSHTASAVNYVQVTGAATGTGVVVSAQGSDSNVEMQLRPKGSGNMTLQDGNATAGLQVITRATGGDSFLTVQRDTSRVNLGIGGGATNASMVFLSKGTGAIDLAAGSSGVNISNGGTVTAITRTTAGSGYTSLPSIAISAPTTAGGVTATANPLMSITSGTQTINNGGSGYTVGDTLTVSGGTGTAVTFSVATVSAGVITSLTITGSGAYSVLPTFPAVLTGGTGTSATVTFSFSIATATATITNAGSGYVEQPTVTFSGGGGSGAAAYATVGSQTTLKSLATSWLFDTAAGTQFQITSTSGANSYPFATGGSNGAGMGVTSSATNASFTFTSKGTSAIDFYTNGYGSLGLRVSHTASAVNYVQVTGAATGASPTISAQGSDTNIPLTLNSKGNNGIVFQTRGGGTPRIALQLLDSGSASVNYLQIQSNISGAGPVLSVLGTDTNIDLNLTPKGTGVVKVGTNTVLDAGNYNNYAPTKTGTGASGSWGISVTGSAGSVAWSGVTGTPTTLSGYGITDAQATLVSGTSIKTVNGVSVLGSGNIQIDGGVTSFNTRTGAVTLSSGDVTTALGFTPYNNSNPSGYITSSALSGYLTSASAASTYLPLAGGTITTSGSTGSLVISDTGANGANIRLAGNGATTPNKNIRAQNGNLEIINSAYSASLVQVTDAGALNAIGAITQNGNQVLHAGNYKSYDGILRALGDGGGINFNTLTYNSMYYGYIENSANKPGSYSYPYGTILTFDPGQGAGGRAQIYISHAGNDLIFRGGWNGNDSWQSWNKVLTNNNYTSYSPSLTGSGASGTWGISISGSAAQLGGYGPNQTGGANTIVQRDSNGYIQNSYFYTSGGGSERNSSGLGYFTGYNSSDYYIRSYTPAAAAAAMGALTTGNYNSYALPLSGGILTGAMRAPQITAGGSTNTDANLGVQGSSHLTGTIYYGGAVGNVNSWSSLSTSSSGTHTFSGSRFIFDRYGYGSQALIDLQQGSITLSQPTSITSNLGVLRSRLTFSSSSSDANHSIYNNYNNIDGEGGWDGMKMNVYAGLRIRTGNGSGAVPTQIFGLDSNGIRVDGGIRQGNDLARPLASWGSSGATGMVIFKLPGSSGNYGMLHMVFDIYEYNSNSVSTVIIGGHNWASGWYNVGANVIGQLGKQVRLGYVDGQYCIVFGDASSYWEYGQIVFRKIQNGAYYTNVMDLGGSYPAYLTTSASFTNISGDLRALRTPASFNAGGAITQAGNQVLHAGNINSYIPNWSSGVAGNYLVQRDVNGYIFANHINFSTSESENPTISSFFTSNGDGWSRKSSLAHVKNSIRGIADGTWGINITGNAGSANTLGTTRNINGIGFNGSANIDTTEWFHSDRDFPSGTLITTSINYAVSFGDPFVLEIRGNSYGNIIPLDLLYQGYIYADTIINHGGLSNGLMIQGLVAINNGGNLCFWFPSQGYWNGYNVKVYTAYATRAVNRVTSITGTGKPTTAKEVELSSNIRQSLHSSNFGNYALPLSGGTLTGTLNTNGRFSANNGMQFFGAFILGGSGASYDNSTGARMSENYGALWNFSNSATWHHQIINGSSLIGFQANGGNFGGGNILASGNITAYYSDERLKTKITTITNALDKVRSLEGFIYIENELAKSLGYTNSGEQAGVSAQRVKAVLPQAVSLAPVDMQGVPETGAIISKSGKNYLTVDYSRLSPLLIEAIKEQDQEVIDLRNRVAHLESLINKLIGD